MKIVYSGCAVNELVRLREFIAANDPSMAQRIATELVTRIESLLIFPGMGRPIELAPEPNTVREFVFESYIVRYTLHSDAIIILRLWHHYESRG